ncbi:MAG: EF-hand domain-containing protein [Pirellulaceae bacterium]|jgi:hypothetical protein|nr:EF-hand domain-containing protein [Pirellulaceae bacterium]MDP7016975.1 EF-hand domain-containing protein [Pirellulaceae bacterium]
MKTRRLVVATLVALSLPLLIQTTYAQREVSGFGAPKGQYSLRGFGKSEAGRPTVIEVDRRYAEIQIEKFDRNKDGALSRSESLSTGYKDVLSRWFSHDANGDGRLTPSELAHSYAKTRVDKEVKARRTAAAKRRVAGIEVTSADKSNASNHVKQLDANRDRKLSSTELGVSYGSNAPNMMREFDTNRSGFLGSSEFAVFFAKQRKQQQDQQKLVHMQLSSQLVVWNGRSSYRMSGAKQVVVQPSAAAAQEMVRRYDTNQNGTLEPNELARPGGDYNGADTDGNGQLTQAELMAWIQRAQKQTAGGGSRSGWFAERDRNLDGQVSMSEYAETWTDALLAEFGRYDSNQDGLISAAESASPSTPNARVFTSSHVRVIETHVGASSAIRIDDDITIGDLDVQLTITHQGLTNLDVYLISPSGKRVDLFKGAGKPWKGNNLAATVFDDESTVDMAKVQPPFRGAFGPEKGPESAGLSSYDGDRTRGVWRLFVDGSRSGRPGLINTWSLIVTPQE